MNWLASAVLRCSACKMHLPLCICALIPRIDTRTRVLLIAHHYENKKSTGTALLVARSLTNCEVLVRGRHSAPHSAVAWADGSQPLFLFPGGTPIERWANHSEPVTLIVPDGTYGQASRVRQRVPGMLDVPSVTVGGGPSLYRLRRAPFPGALSTIEAVARALGVLEGPEVQQALEKLFETMVERTLSTRPPIRR